MAQLNSRGTMTRARWDFFEHSNGWASIFGTVSGGSIGAYLANNSTATMQLDIYALYWFASVASPWDVRLLMPPLVLTPVSPTDIEIHATQPDRAQLAGVMGMFSAIASQYFTIQRVSNSLTSGVVQPIPGQPFMTLPPQWAIAIAGTPSTGPAELSLNVWYQEVVDNLSPAR